MSEHKLQRPKPKVKYSLVRANKTNGRRKLSKFYDTVRPEVRKAWKENKG